MPDRLNVVLPKRRAISEEDYHDALVAGLARVANQIGRGNLADKSCRTPRALANLFTEGKDTSGKGLIDFLIADASALDEVLGLYGYGLHKLPTGEAGDDHALIADTAKLASVHSEAMRDGRRDHHDTLRIAEAARPVVAACCGIIAEADRFRRPRAA